jgi:hypothetical protein
MDNELAWVLGMFTFLLFVLLLGAAIVMTIYHKWTNKHEALPRVNIGRPENEPEEIFDAKDEYYVLTCYDVLGVPINATTQRIEQAYRDRLRLLSAKGRDPGDAEWRMKLDQARDVLLDPGLRKEYDDFLDLRDRELLMSVAVDKPPYGKKFKKPLRRGGYTGT